MLNAGPLDQRITLQYPVQAQDATGAITSTWTTLRDAWAKVSPIKGRELLSGWATLQDHDTRIVIRTAQDLVALTPKWRVVHRGRIYNLYSVGESNMGREFLELLAKTGMNEG